MLDIERQLKAYGYTDLDHLDPSGRHVYFHRVHFPISQHYFIEEFKQYVRRVEHANSTHKCNSKNTTRPAEKLQEAF